MKKRLILTSIISIILVVTLLIGTTYSIFVTEHIDENLNVYHTGNLDVTYTLSEDNIVFTNKMPVNEDDVTFIHPYRITINNTGNVAYKFNVILTDTTATTKIDYQYIMTKVGKLESKPLADCTNNIIKEGVVVPSNDSVIIDIRVYLSENTPNSEIGKSFSAKLSIDGLAVYNENDDIDNSILMLPSDNFLSQKVIDLYNDGSGITNVNIGGDTANPKVYLNATQGIMLDNNGDYRYYGADPNNYVWYNDELWRIISVGNVKSSETDTVGETRVKIVKDGILTDDNGLDSYSYDISKFMTHSCMLYGECEYDYGVNDWSVAKLMTELNTLYFNSTSGNCYTGNFHENTNEVITCDFSNTGLSQKARDLTADALYYLGGASEYQGLYADDYYNFERGSDVWPSTEGYCEDDACPRATTWTGRVGIIYKSDYVYATDLSLCTSTGGCADNNWLSNYGTGYVWTISPYSLESNSVLKAEDSMIPVLYVEEEDNVLPVQYLKSNVIITEGDGTSENPYKLSI